MVRLTAISICLLFCLNLSYAEAAFRLGEKGPRVNGFLEFVFGGKLGHDTTKHDSYNMLEQRLQLKTTLYPKFSQLLKDWSSELNFRGDFFVDEYFGAKTGFELRELNLALTPLNWLDVKAGRQVFTWGTGDYLFVNDLFPKDYISFYIGRDDEYLKKPSDGIKFSFYSNEVNLDFVIVPLFEPNTIPKGDRLSFFDSFQGGIAGRESDRHLIEPSRQLNNTEYATRLYRNFSSYEVAIYTFRGFCKMPNSYLNESNRDLFYPRLDAYGTSIRGPGLGGIVNLEIGYYNSLQDGNGDNRLIENSKMKYLAGYDRDLGNDLSIGLQYLLEQTLDYDNYQSALLVSDYRWDERRHLVTLRVTKLYKNQTVRAGLFTFYSPSDEEIYLRPSIDYDVNDSLKLTLGANLIWGRDDITAFGQMEHNKNIYFRARYSF